MKFTDTELLMYADGSLDKDRAKLLEEAALHNKELASTLAALDASRLPYKTAYCSVRRYLPTKHSPRFLHLIDRAGVV